MQHCHSCNKRSTWQLRKDSWFSFKFDSCESTRADFACMYEAAREDSGLDQIKVYAHNVCNSSKRRSVVKRVVVPHRRSSADIVFATELRPPGDWAARTLGDSLTTDHVVDARVALLRPVWHVRMVAGKSIPPNSPMAHMGVSAHPFPLVSTPGGLVMIRLALAWLCFMIGEIAPVTDAPLSWALANKLVLEPGECIVITSAIA